MAGSISISTGFCGWLFDHPHRFLWLALYPSLQVTVAGSVTIPTGFYGWLCIHLYRLLSLALCLSSFKQHLIPFWQVLFLLKLRNVYCSIFILFHHILQLLVFVIIIILLLLYTGFSPPFILRNGR